MEASINDGDNFSVAAIIVTYNRLDKLKKTLVAYEKQRYRPRYIIVVNNASNDGTLEYLNQWKNSYSSIKKIIVNTDKNLGGSGGFFEGQKVAANLLDAQWIMVADDDAYPEEDYIFKIKEYIENLGDIEDISVICGKVIENEGYVNTHRTKKSNFFSSHLYKPVSRNEYESEDSIELDFASYVGIIINKEKMIKVGLVNPEYFIYHDDTDHAYRLGVVGKIICLSSIAMQHDCGKAKLDENTWKAYYDYRNRLYTCKKINYIKFLLLIPIYIAKSLLCPLKGRKLSDIKARLTAVFDGIRGKLGKHSVYAPGWKA